MAMKQPKQTPYIMKSELSGSWYIVTKYVQKRGMCAIGPDAGKTFDYLIAREKFDCTERMRAILKAEIEDALAGVKMLRDEARKGNVEIVHRVRSAAGSDLRGRSNRASGPRKVRRAS
jgi:hydrogenase maturation factor